MMNLIASAHIVILYVCTCGITFSIFSIVASHSISEINLPPEHLTYYFNEFPEEAEKCLKDDNCLYKHHAQREGCWGYEYNCNSSKAYHVRPRCPGDHRGWVLTKEAQYDTFFTQADFGYVKNQREELMLICEPTYPDDSSLECSKYLRFCRGRNLMLNFTGLIGRGNNLRYKTDILGPGQIGGHCKQYNEEMLKQELDHMGALQSWGPELSNFVNLKKKPISGKFCDIVIEKPTFIMKLDAAVNMYHHFCDFFNLYTSLHVNASHPSAFSKDINILVWETFTYNSAFQDTFKAFTTNPIWDLKQFRGKVVCFKNLVLPLLPRMIYGLYYNMPLIYGCERSGLFHAFYKHVLHSLDVKLNLRLNNKVRVTFLSRETTFRAVLNEKEIIKELQKDADYDVKRVVYNRSMPFVKQLAITHNTDVFISMHGAGLTHLVFLPDWAAVFEIYNCEDRNCYADLARLKGLKYVTWENKEKMVQQDQGHHPEGGPHAKFTNYSFDIQEFVRLVKECAQYVKNRPDFKSFVEGSLKSLYSQHGEL